MKEQYTCYSSSYDAPLVISVRTSRWLLLLLIFSHVIVAFLIVTLVTISLWLQLIILILISLSFIYYYQLHISRHLKKSVLSVRQHRYRGWFIISNRNEELAVDLQGSSYSSPWLVILNFKHEVSGNYTVIIPSDAVSAALHRQLRVRLKMLGE